MAVSARSDFVEMFRDRLESHKASLGKKIRRWRHGWQGPRCSRLRQHWNDRSERPHARRGDRLSFDRGDLSVKLKTFVVNRLLEGLILGQ